MARITLISSEHHRYLKQLAFIEDFPAYTTERLGDDLILWYRVGDSIASLDFRIESKTGEITVFGDAAVIRRVLQCDLQNLPQDHKEETCGAFHWQLWQQYRGIRPVLFADAFEGLSWTILGQQITVTLAVQLKNALAHSYGTVFDGITRSIAVFPSARQLSRVTVEQLQLLHLSRQKAAALIGLAQAIDGGHWALEPLYQLPTHLALEELQQFKGIGPWTAEYSLNRVFGHPDVIPAADIGLRRAWSRITGQTMLVSENSLRVYAQCWAGWRSDFAFWLWLSNLDDRKRKNRVPPH